MEVLARFLGYGSSMKAMGAYPKVFGPEDHLL